MGMVGALFGLLTSLYWGNYVVAPVSVKEYLKYRQVSYEWYNEKLMILHQENKTQQNYIFYDRALNLVQNTHIVGLSLCRIIEL